MQLFRADNPSHPISEGDLKQEAQKKLLMAVYMCFKSLNSA